MKNMSWQELSDYLCERYDKNIWQVDYCYLLDEDIND